MITETMINIYSLSYAKEFMREVRKVEIEQAEWHRKHPEEPYVIGGIKACEIFTRKAFADGARWAVEQMKGGEE